MSADQPEWTAPPEAVIAFLDGDGCDDEAFASLRRRLTLAAPWILDSAAGTAYTARKLAEAEKRVAVKALRWLADDIKGERPTSATRDLASAIYADARRIESGEVTLP